MTCLALRTCLFKPLASVRKQKLLPATRVIGPFGPKMTEGLRNEFPGLSVSGGQKSPKTESKNVNVGEKYLTLGSPKPHPSKPHPCSMPQAKTEVALQFSESCTAEVALQRLLFCCAEVIFAKSCAAASEKLQCCQCNIEKAALQESGAFLPLSCGFQTPTFRLPCLGPADDFDSFRLAFERFGPWGREAPGTHFGRCHFGLERPKAATVAGPESPKFHRHVRIANLPQGHKN